MARQRKVVTEEPEAKSNKINRQAFINALSKVKPGLSSKEIIEHSTHFIFDNDKIWTYNDQITIMQKFDSGLTGAVKADSFFKLLDRIPDEEISIELEEGKVKISGKKIKAHIKIDPDVKITPIQVPAINSKRWETLPDNFDKAISFAAFSCSKNMIRPELTCLLIEKGFCIGCDTFRGTKYTLSSTMEQEFLLPAMAGKELSNYNPHKVIFDEEGGWLHFINREIMSEEKEGCNGECCCGGGCSEDSECDKSECECDKEKEKELTTFSCRTYPDKYPEQIWGFFEVDGEEIVLPEGFVDAVARAEVLISADFDLDRIVTLVIEDNKVVCSSEGAYGDFEETAEVEYNGPKLDVKVHPVLLSEILKHLTTVVIGDRLLFKGEGFSHGICLSC